MIYFISSELWLFVFFEEAVHFINSRGEGKPIIVTHILFIIGGRDESSGSLLGLLGHHPGGSFGVLHYSLPRVEVWTPQLAYARWILVGLWFLAGVEWLLSRSF